MDHADARVVIADLQAFGVAIAGVQRIVHVVNLEVVLHLRSRKARDESKHIKTVNPSCRDVTPWPICKEAAQVVLELNGLMALKMLTVADLTFVPETLD